MDNKKETEEEIALMLKDQEIAKTFDLANKYCIVSDKHNPYQIIDAIGILLANVIHSHLPQEISTEEEYINLVIQNLNQIIPYHISKFKQREEKVSENVDQKS